MCSTILNQIDTSNSDMLASNVLSMLETYEEEEHNDPCEFSSTDNNICRDTLLAIASFLKDNPTKCPTKVHKAYNHMLMDLWARCSCKASGECPLHREVALDEFVATISAVVFSAIPPDFVHSASALMSLSAETETKALPSFAANTFANLEVLSIFLQYRLQYTLHLMHDLINDGKAIGGNNVSVVAVHMPDIINELQTPSAIDKLRDVEPFAGDSPEQWCMFWVTLISKVNATPTEKRSALDFAALVPEHANRQRQLGRCKSEPADAATTASASAGVTSMVATAEGEKGAGAKTCMSLLTVSEILRFEAPRTGTDVGLFSASTEKLGTLKPDMLVVKTFGQGLQTYLYNIAISQRMLSGGDWLDRVKIDVLEKAPKLVAPTADNNLRLHFFGPISTTRTKRALEVCSAFGFVFFLSPMSSLNSEVFCPASLARIVAQEEEATMQLEQTPAHIYWDQKSNCLLPVDSVDGSDKGAGSFEVQLLSLKVKPAYAKSENLELTWVGPPSATPPAKESQGGRGGKGRGRGQKISRDTAADASEPNMSVGSVGPSACVAHMSKVARDATAPTQEPKGAKRRACASGGGGNLAAKHLLK